MENIRETNEDAITSKLSAVTKGYLKDLVVLELEPEFLLKAIKPNFLYFLYFLGVLFCTF